jgi:hypothetical protein
MGQDPTTGLMITEIKCDDHWLQKIYGLPSSWATELYFRIFKLGNRTIFQDIFATVSIVFFLWKDESANPNHHRCFRVYPQFMTILVGIMIFQQWMESNKSYFRQTRLKPPKSICRKRPLLFVSALRLLRRDFIRHWGYLGGRNLWNHVP